MKIKTIMLLAAACLFGFTNLIFSQEQVSPETSRDTADTSGNQDNLEYIRGRVVSIDDKKNEIVIEQDLTHDKRTFVVPAERLSYFTINDHVKIWVKPGENTVQDIQKIRVWHPHPAAP